MRKLLSTAVVMGLMASTTFAPVYADVAAGALPSLNSATNAGVTTNGTNMNVQITGGQGSLGTLNWNTYNVGKDASVNYEFSAHNQTALNKVAATGGLSQIYGKITSSGCANCGYDATGKVILINPNGVLFGEGANVNLNSFTVSTLDGYYDNEKNQLILNKDANQTDFGIAVQNGAEIYGDKNVTFASKNISLYNGSKISTSTVPNVGDTAFGKVKLVTADGVNFTYYNNGAVSGISGIKGSTDKMVISMNGDITSGNIDARNYSTANGSEINLKGATLKAVKAVKGNDGNIWLTASKDIITENSTLTTVNAAGAESRNGGNVQLLAGNKASVGTGKINAVGDVDIISQGQDVVVDKTNIETAKNVTLNAARYASIQNASNVKGNNVTVNGSTRGQVVSSVVTANQDVNLSGGELAWAEKATINAGKDINVSAPQGSLLLNNSLLTAKNNVNLTSKDSVTSEKLAGTTFTAAKDVNVESTAESVILTGTSQFVPSGKLNLKGAKNVEINAESDLTTANTNMTAGKNIILSSKTGSVNVNDSTKFLAAEKIYIQGANNVTTTGTVDLNNIQTNINAGKDVNVTLANVGNRQNGLVAKAGDNMTVTTDGTLSVSSLISGKDMTINANKVIAGLPYTTEQKLPGDDSERSYIEVGGEFTSNVANDNYVITASGDLTDDGNYNQRHHIQYGSEEKILLVNKRPVDNKVTDPDMPDIDNGDDIDVIKPGELPADPTPGDGNGGNNGGDNNGGNTGDNGNNGGDNNGGNTGDNGNNGDDCDGDPAKGDTPIDEETPGITLGQNILKYTVQTAEQKKY